MTGQGAVRSEIGRQQGHQPVLVKNHQGMIREPVAVIVHVVTSEKEGGILAGADKLVPITLVIRRVTFDGIIRQGFRR